MVRYKAETTNQSEQEDCSYLVAGASNDGGEDSPGGVIAGKSSLAHAGAVVNDKGGNILVTHDEVVGVGAA